jgi:hypothetical protein
VSLELTDLGYVEDGDNLVTLAMNGWGDADPWWLNLQTHPDATAELKGSTRDDPYPCLG